MLTSFHVKQLGRVQAQNASRPCTGRQTLAAVGNARRQGRGSLRSDRGQPTPPGVSCWPALYTCIISCSLQCKQRGPTQNQAPLVQGNAMAHPRMLLACCGLHLPVPPGQGPHIALLGPQPWAPLCAPDKLGRLTWLALLAGSCAGRGGGACEAVQRSGSDAR